MNAKRSLNTTHQFVFAAGAIEDSSALLFHRTFRLNHAVRSKQFEAERTWSAPASYYDLTAAAVAALRRSRWLAQVLLWIPYRTSLCTWSHRSNTPRRRSILHPCRIQDPSQRLGFSLQCLLLFVPVPVPEGT